MSRAPWDDPAREALTEFVPGRVRYGPPGDGETGSEPDSPDYDKD